MNVKKFSEAMGDVDDRYIVEAVSYKRKVAKSRIIRRVIIAASIAAVFLIGVSIINMQRNTIPLSDRSHNVAVRYTSNPFIFFRHSGSLIGLTEEELFTKFDTVIFKGTIKEIKNIVVDFNGEKEYRAIAQIGVGKVYRGTCSEGDTVSVMLPCPISGWIHVTDTSTVSEMKAGVTGIFMPMVLDDESALWMENGASLDKRDLADYDFVDGERYAFLETDSGLVFSRWAYASIADATTLDEVEEYIEKMLERLYGHKIK